MEEKEAIVCYKIETLFKKDIKESKNTIIFCKEKMSEVSKVVDYLNLNKIDYRTLHLVPDDYKETFEKLISFWSKLHGITILVKLPV